MATQGTESERHYVACAPTGIAAILLPGGRTVHNTFSIPIGVRQETPSQLSYEHWQRERLFKADIIIVDEISMLNSTVFHHMSKVLQSMYTASQPESSLPFAGKIIVTGGDWKQLLPIVNRGSVQECAAASVKRSPMFRSFKKMRLTKNLRTGDGQEEFSTFLKAIGTGRIGDAQHFGALQVSTYHNLHILMINILVRREEHRQGLGRAHRVPLSRRVAQRAIEERS